MTTPFSKASESLYTFPSTEEKPARFIMIPIDPETGRAFPREEFPPKRLQFWPESLSYDRGTIGWQEQSFPGSTHSLFSWTGNSSPTLSFDAEMASDSDPAFFGSNSQNLSDGRRFNHDIDINAALAWFVALTNPEYGSIDGQRSFNNADPFKPPPIIQIVPEGLMSGGKFLSAQSIVGASNVGNLSQANPSLDTNARNGSSAQGSTFRGVTLSHLEGTDFYGVISQLSINYEKFFPSGFPRKVKLSLAFKEVMQIGATIQPHSRSRNLRVAETFSLNV